MSNNRFTISEEEKSDIKKLYVLNEQGYQDNQLPKKDYSLPKSPEFRGGVQGTPGKITYKFNDATTTQNLGASMFLNGVDKIDTNSEVFKNAIYKIKFVLKYSEGVIPVTIKGGASNVGTSKGYNNAALANRRRDNFIKALKTSLGGSFSRLNITSGDAIVGKATVKGSPEANAEQFVQISYPEKIGIVTGSVKDAIDSTDVASRLSQITPDRMEDKIVNDPKAKSMIVKIWYKGDKKTFTDKIFNSTGSPVHELIDYETAKGLRFN